MDFFQHIQWRPQIGDPTFMGWLTVLAYACASLTALLAARNARRSPANPGAAPTTWAAVAVLMLLLCINKQLDLQSLFTDIGRVFATKNHWYHRRRDIQKWFVLGALTLSLVTTLLLAFKFPDFWKRSLLLASGLAFLLTFILVRAISFHHVDTLLNLTFFHVRMNWFLELTGISLVTLAAILDYRKTPPATAHPGHPH